MGEVVVQDEQGISDFEALRSAIHKGPHRLVFFAFDLLHLDGSDPGEHRLGPENFEFQFSPSASPRTTSSAHQPTD
jgi:hypothetical protein